MLSIHNSIHIPATKSLVLTKPIDQALTVRLTLSISSKWTAFVSTRKLNSVPIRLVSEMRISHQIGDKTMSNGDEKYQHNPVNCRQLMSVDSTETHQAQSWVCN